MESLAKAGKNATEMLAALAKAPPQCLSRAIATVALSLRRLPQRAKISLMLPAGR